MTGSAAPTPLHGPALRALQRELVGAQDEQIARVLAIVDNLAVRGEADRLIAPLRGRLAELRPPRQLNLSRLLVIPLEPLIVDAAGWNPGAPSIPRSALSPLAQQVTHELGAFAEAISTASALLLRNAELDLILETGAALWLRAAAILAVAPVPPGWTAASGLRPRDHTELTRTLAPLLAQAPALLHIVVRARAGMDPEPAALGAILAAVAPAGSLPLTMMIAMAMEWLPRPEHLIRMADDFAARQSDPGLRAAADRAVDSVLDGMEQAPLPSPNMASAAQDVRRIAVMLKDLALCPERLAGRRRRIEQVRRGVDVACRERFTGELEAQLLTRSPDMAAGGDDTITAMELAARELRRFETIARQIGSAEHYDRHLQHAAEVLRPIAGEDASALIGRIRLVEILRGPDAAMAMLAAVGA
jgi:hypothetical protein